MQAQLITDKFETVIDSVDYPCPIPVTVRYSYWGGKGGDEIADITVIDNRDGDGRELSLTAEQEKDLIEEIWDDVRQQEGY